jgi:competence ComEA-like helix-hairpin-helix protein
MDWFMQGLTPSEKKGILVIVGVITLAAIIRILNPFVIKSNPYDYHASDSTFTRISLTQYVKPPEHKEKTARELKSETKNLLPSSVDLNLAAKSDLVKLPRIGPAIAQRIIDYRTKYGTFKSLDELKNVKGIGTKTFENIRPFLKEIAIK